MKTKTILNNSLLTKKIRTVSALMAVLKIAICVPLSERDPGRGNKKIQFLELSLKSLIILVLCLSTSNIFAASSFNGATVKSAQSICSGSTPTPLTLNIATCSGAAAYSISAYEWQESDDNGVSDAWVIALGGSGATTLSYSPPALTKKIYYRCKITVSNVCAGLSSPYNTASVLININTPPTIIVQPSNQTTCAGSSATFRVTASGSGLKYQWQYATSSTGVFANVTNTVGITGATTASLSITASTANNGYYYKCIVTGTCGKATSTAAILSLNTATSITIHPYTQNICLGSNASFSVIAAGAGTLTYQWQYASSSIGAFNNVTNAAGISGATTANLSITASTANNGYYYKCIVTGTCGTATSNAASLNLNTAPSITSQPNSQITCSGSNATFSVTATGTNLTYQWQKCATLVGLYTNINNATSSTYSFTTISTDNGYNYRCIISGSCGSSLTSTSALLTINEAPAISTQPINQTAIEGDIASFTVAATGNGLTYQWQKSITSNGTYADISGATNPNYSFTSSNYDNGFYYRCIVNGSCSPFAISNSASLTILPLYNELNYSYTDFFSSQNFTNFMVKDTILPCGSPYILKSALLKVQLDAGEEYTLGSQTFSASVYFTTKILDASRNQLASVLGESLSISQTAPKQLYIFDITSFASSKSYADINLISFAVNSSTVSAILNGKLRFHVWIETEYNVGVSSHTITGITKFLTAMSTTSATNPVEFTWYSSCDNIPQYEFQLLRLYNSTEGLAETDVQTTVDWSKAMSVFVDGSKTSLKLQVNEGTGFYTWRIRPIGNYYEGAEANSLNWGEWSNSLADGAGINYTSGIAPDAYTFFFNQPEADKNWIYNRVFTEDTRISENMSYADGLGKIFQTQHKMQSDDKTLISQTVYDFSGRGALQSIAAPVSNSSMAYKTNYLTHNGNLYDADNFDTETNATNPDAVDGGDLTNYYSDSNTDLTIPNAENYPFSQSVIDPLNRVKESGSAGSIFRIGGSAEGKSRTYKNYYSSTTDEELIKLFANEAPNADKVHKIISVDPNNVTRVTYQMADGSVLANCLSGKSDLTEPVDYEPYTVSGTVNGDMQIDEYTIEKSEVLPPFLEPGFTINVNYSLTPSQIEADCGNFCISCDYNVEVWVKNTETGEKVATWSLQYGPSACTSSPATLDLGNQTVSGLEPGTYSVGRTISVNNQSAQNSGNTNLDDHLENIASGIETNIDDNYADLRALLEANDLDGFYELLAKPIDHGGYGIDELELVDGNTITLNKGCCPVTFTVEKCTLPCDEGTPDFEALLTDKWGDKFGKHMYNYFYKDASTYEHLYEVKSDPIATLEFTNLGNGVVGADISIKVIPDNSSLFLPNIELVNGTYTFQGLHALAGQLATDINNLGLSAYTASANNGILTITSHINNLGYIGHIEITSSVGAFDIANTIPTTSLGSNPMETATIDFSSTDFAIDGYFNIMIAHMLHEVNLDGTPVYNCNDLYNAWNALVQTYDISQYVYHSTGGGYYSIKDYNLMEAFLKSVGKIYSGFSNHPYSYYDYNDASNTHKFYGSGYTEYAYKAFELDTIDLNDNSSYGATNYGNYENCISSTDPSSSNYPQAFDIDGSFAWDADILTEASEDKLWENFYNCISSADEFAVDGLSSLDALGLSLDCDQADADCINSLVENAKDLCESTCLSHLDAFRFEAEDALKKNGSSYTDYDIDCMAYSLVEECEKNCQLTVDFDDANSNGTYDNGETLNRVGTDEEIAKMQKAMTYVVHVAYGSDCGTNSIFYSTSHDLYFSDYIIDKCNSDLQKLVSSGITVITISEIEAYFTIAYNQFTGSTGIPFTLGDGPCQFNFSVNVSHFPIDENSEISINSNNQISFHYVGGHVSNMLDLSGGCDASKSCTFCYKWTPIVIPTDVVDTIKVITCEEASASAIRASFDIQLDSCENAQLNYFEDTYNATCATPDSINDELSYSFDLSYHHFTLFYYDRTGRLIKTVPPKGITSNANFPYSDRDHETNYGFATTYDYNSLGQMVAKTSVDAGTVKYIYNSLGQLRYSQNAVQAAANKFSYIKYDYLSRPIEAGQGSICSTCDIKLASELTAKADDQTLPVSGEEIIVTVYNDADASAIYTDARGVTYTQEYLDNRISYTYSDEDGSAATTTDRIYTYYSYSPHGNVEWFIQNIPGLGNIQTWFDYDLVSQNVTEVKYQEGKADQYFYRYSYDEDNRLVKSETSNNGQLWDTDATYEYYAFGPTKRTVMGQDKVQGLDYIYTLQGRLKAINHPELGNGSDAGQDGVVGSANETIPADAFGELLNYYDGDFNRTGSVFNNLSTSNTLLTELNNTHGEAAFTTSGNFKSYYNGFIANTITNNAASGITNKAQQAMASMYLYDDMGRLVQSTIDFYSGSAWEGSTGPNSDYFERFGYDDNGNIKEATRNTYH